MTISDYLKLAGLFLVPAGGIWGVIKYFAKRDRASIDGAIKRAFSEVDILRKDLIVAQRDLEVLKEQVKALPSKDLLQARFEAMDERLDRRFEALALRIEAMAVKIAEGMRCPNGQISNGCVL